jgi:hypothetical protein
MQCNLDNGGVAARGSAGELERTTSPLGVIAPLPPSLAPSFGYPDTSQDDGWTYTAPPSCWAYHHPKAYERWAIAFRRRCEAAAKEEEEREERFKKAEEAGMKAAAERFKKAQEAGMKAAAAAAAAAAAEKEAKAKAAFEEEAAAAAARAAEEAAAAAADTAVEEARLKAEEEEAAVAAAAAKAKADEEAAEAGRKAAAAEASAQDAAAKAESAAAAAAAEVESAAAAEAAEASKAATEDPFQSPQRPKRKTPSDEETTSTNLQQTRSPFETQARTPRAGVESTPAPITPAVELPRVTRSAARAKEQPRKSQRRK